MRALDSLAQHLPAAERGVGAVGVLETVLAGGEVDLGARVLSRVLYFWHLHNVESAYSSFQGFMVKQYHGEGDIIFNAIGTSDT